MITVACVLKSGGIYDASWVEKLKSGVGQHLKMPHRFVCLADVDVPCERIPLRHDWAGWWSKIELFKIMDPVLFFDLDTLIVGDISGLAKQAEEWGLTALRDFYRPDGIQSAVMGWGVDMHRVYDLFADDPAGWQAKIGDRGDQGFLESALNLPGVWRWQDTLPGQVVSYKGHCRNGIPADARAICLHGFPKFSDMPENDPVRVAWEHAS